MGTRDRTAICATCGIEFLVTGRAPGQRRCPGCRALDRLTARRRGTLRWFDPRRGYGFIRDDEGGDLFVHRSELGPRPRIRPGVRVEFEPHENERGPLARRVRVVADEAPSG